MTTAAQSIIKEAQQLLQDESGVRWAATELVDHLNDGQREIAVIRPDLAAVTSALVLAAGAKQTLPAACISFMDMKRNTGGRAISKVDQRVLDALDPAWYSGVTSTTIQHFCYNETTPDVVWVYPPATAATSVEIEYSAMPAGTPAASGLPYSTVTGNIDLPDSCKNPLLHFVMARAFLKDAEFGGNAAFSAAHAQLFRDGLNTDKATGAEVAPKVNE
jgi:hypothetical protein